MKRQFLTAMLPASACALPLSQRASSARPTEDPSREWTAPSGGGALCSPQWASSLPLLRRGPLCTAERPRGTLCESFPVALLREILPFFKARFDIFTGRTSGAFWSRKKAGILSFMFTKPLIGLFIQLDSIMSSAGMGVQPYLIRNTTLKGFFSITKCSVARRLVR